MISQLVIIPTGGLANRMRVIASAISLAQYYNLVPVILWNNTEGLKADFEDLFLPLPHASGRIENNRKARYNISGTKDYLLRWLPLHLRFNHVIHNFNAYEQGDLADRLQGKSGSAVIISCNPLQPRYNLSQLFVPQRHIQEQIDAMASRFTPHTIGVHIRRTDNNLSIRQSPLEVFIEKLDTELQHDPDASFFLATDDEEVKKHLRKRFPGRIFTGTQPADRNSVTGMTDAVIDLYALSRTRKIIGSYFSSYSQMAADLGEIAVEYALKT